MTFWRPKLPKFCAMVVSWIAILFADSVVQADEIANWLDDEIVKTVFPGAAHVGGVEGNPPAATLYRDRDPNPAGYIFATADVVESVGFASTPFTIIAAINLDGRLTGVALVQHTEPIIDYNMLHDRVARFLTQYEDLPYQDAWQINPEGVSGAGEVDGISAATISAILFHQSIIRAARAVAHSRGLIGDNAGVDMIAYEPATWPSLIDDRAIAHLSVGGTPNQPEVDLYTALVTPAHIGRNLLGDTWYRLFVSTHSGADTVFLLMSNGSSSFIGGDVFRTGTFDRVRLRQQDRVVELARDDYRFMPFLRGAEVPDFQDIGLFRLPADRGIDPMQPWHVDLAMDDKGFASGGQVETLTYELPERYVLTVAQTTTGASAIATSDAFAAWRAQSANIALLTALLAVLTVILFAQRILTRYSRTYTTIRLTFLAAVLVWLGWMIGGQLSIVHIVTWLQSAIGSMSIDVFLADPIIAILVAYTVVTFLIWGRGIFCGWLCPFGALQELLAKLARGLRLPQLSLSAAMHRKLWPVKYVVLLGLIVVSFVSMPTANSVAEVEPFKTAISLHFARSWPYLVYAVALLLVGLFVERFFCRFLCPLGAVMAIGGRLRIGNWLQRRKECGSPCRLCERACPIQAIEPNGKIKMSECFYCLDCQLLYHDAHKCPPLAKQRKARPANDPAPTFAVAPSPS